MPKQGHFAKSGKIKRVNDFKVKRQSQGQVIGREKLTDFLVVRYALTAKKRVAPADRETMQRLLMEISDRIVEFDGDLLRLMPDLLSSLNSRVPWQFFQQVLTEWNVLEHFLQRELPAVPLAERVRVTSTIPTDKLVSMVTDLLVKRIVTITFIKQPNTSRAVKDKMAVMLRQAVFDGHEIDWQRVKALLAPFQYKVDQQLDEGTKKWLTELSQQ